MLPPDAIAEAPVEDRPVPAGWGHPGGVKRSEVRGHRQERITMDPQWIISAIAILVVGVIAWRVWGGRE